MAIALRSTPADGAGITESGSTQSLTASMPSGVVAGDVLVAWIVGDGTIANTTFTDTGWTQLSPADEYGSAPTKLTKAYYYVVTNPASIPALSFTTTDAAGRWTIEVAAFSGVDNATPIDAAAVLTQFTNVVSAALTGITTVADNAWLISCIATGYSANSMTDPTGMTDICQHTLSVGRAAGMAYEDITPAGATGAITWNRNPSGVTTDWQGINFSLNPATGGGGGGTHPNRQYIWKP